MSKLYDAIDRLEQIAEEEGGSGKEALSPRPPEPKPRSFILRPLLLGALIVMLGCVVLFTVYRWQDWFVRIPQSSSDMKTAEVAPPLPPPAPSALVTEPDKIGAQESYEAGTVVVPSPVTSGTASGNQGLVSSGITLATSSEQGTTKLFSLEQKISGRVGGRNDNNLVSNRQSQTTVIEPQALYFSPEIDTAAARQREETTLTRLLLQAEQRRRDHDWQGAVLLYRQVWEESGNPAVANNLAAALLKLHKKKQAIGILETALTMSPDDPELLKNLYLARQEDR